MVQRVVSAAEEEKKERKRERNYKAVFKTVVGNKSVVKPVRAISDHG